ncbi:MAG: s-methyl-5-thioribose-1-phosphate isomerase [Bacillota bacterium]|jgi:methylthioribose-1-phosphate isomerase|nr:s-methyl-5-thioribose-1-phosphate isomerase [Eubacteriales bacterium]MDI9492599.1 s-methyl-5-thioribose-1-phosphate isomerase [Bacillota bacterium]NLV69378.1 s-methyl-5-thioribose-1-phosphate isomerase [Clostridiales bacterium]HRV33695.1 s-methyl-5-thioribose-1-phosphate isomerase [Anaerovoracaceae bacterium]MDD3536755.1 s-methyl-5-thioribose-1-phosphate isomerase [Eubacteriales bacterium]
MQRADAGLGFIMQYENVAWFQDGKVRILDRRIYPIRTEYVTCQKHEEVAQAIADMVTQSGGPYTAASMGMVLACYESEAMKEADRLAYLKKAAYTLSHARPTTSAKMERFTGSILNAAAKAMREGGDVVDAAREKAVQDLNDRYNRFEPVGEIIASLIPKNGTILTQCWAETDIAMTLRACRNQGNEIKVICAETRPYFQGARLTASCARDMGFDVTVICDNMPAYTMKMKKIDLFTSAADVISCDGYVVNKIGTFQIALAADYWGVPYYATGNPNAAHPTIDTVTIEERDPELALHAMDVKLTLEGVKGYYPAFDITPPELITGIATVKGLMKPDELSGYFA